MEEAPSIARGLGLSCHWKYLGGPCRTRTYNQTIKSWPGPRPHESIASFCIYYRRFCPAFASVASVVSANFHTFCTTTAPRDIPRVAAYIDDGHVYGTGP